MHEFTVCVVPRTTTRERAEEAISTLMEPHRESDDGEQGWWDWYQVGGRWTGVYSEYDPTSDPLNTERCTLCAGTGTRPDGARFGAAWLESTRGCNGCGGTGMAHRWPTQWVDHDGDVVPVTLVSRGPAATQLPLHLVTPDGEAIHKSWWDGETYQEVEEDKWRAMVLETLEPWEGYALVVVDIHI